MNIPTFRLAGRQILLQLRDILTSASQRISSELPDYSTDVGDLSEPKENNIGLGPAIYYLYRKGYVDVNDRRIQITPAGLDSLDSYWVRHRDQLLMVLISGTIGILGTIVGVLLGVLI